jgi:menaquinone-specific isochorismate synthase
VTEPRFVARTRHLAAPVDLLAAAGSDGLLHVQGGQGLAGRGVAARVPVSGAARWLADVEADDEVGRPGTGAVAFGALPFHPDPSADVLVPAVVWGSDGDAAWVTTIGPPHQTPEVPDLGPAAAPEPAAVEPEVAPVRAPEWWCDLVARATAHLREQPEGGLSKVVLAREVLVQQAQPFDRSAVLRRLAATYPGCFLFLVDGFLGASPELLVRRDGGQVRAQPMAGTAPRGSDPEADAALAEGLRSSATYRHEHQITIDMVYDTLLPWCSYLDYEPEPSIVAVANVQHLASYVEGLLSEPAPSVLELVAALHPTPAVSGWPRDLAIAWIDEHEGFERGRYAGAVGWVDATGNGTWAVSIRCAQVRGGEARVVAGNGIVADSDPPTELAETEAKLAAMLSALRGSSTGDDGSSR